MKLKIKGVEYDLQQVLNGATINDLMELKVKTKTDDFPGVSVKSIIATFEGLDPGDQLAFLDSVEAMQSFRGMIFLCRRSAGERVTVDEANDFSLINELEFVDDTPAAEDTPDPKALPASGPADEPDPAA